MLSEVSIQGIFLFFDRIYRIIDCLPFPDEKANNQSADAKKKLRWLLLQVTLTFAKGD
jgi:hypothetical protein